MSREKQIDEMAKVIDDMEQISYIESYDEAFVNTNEIAKHLYNAGYRKQSEGEWIWDKEHSNYKCSLCGEYDTTTPNFCRGCGAKMKGGAE